MSYSGRYGERVSLPSARERKFLRSRVEHGFYLGRKDTAQIAQETGYDEATVARMLNQVREKRYAVRLRADLTGSVN